MSLEFLISNTAFDKMSDDKQGLYKATDDGYQLNVKGVVPKSKVDEFRNNNVELQKQIDASVKKYQGVDLEKYSEFQKIQQKIDDKKLIDAGDIDALVASKVAAVTSDFEAKLETANSQITKLTGENSGIVSKYEIQGGLAKAFSEHKIRPEMQSALTSQVNSMFSVKEGNVVAMEGDKIMTGKNGNLSINEFISTQPDVMKIPSNGGHGSGGGGEGGKENRSSQDKIKAGLEAAQN